MKTSTRQKVALSLVYFGFCFCFCSRVVYFCIGKDMYVPFLKITIGLLFVLLPGCFWLPSLGRKRIEALFTLPDMPSYNFENKHILKLEIELMKAQYK